MESKNMVKYLLLFLFLIPLAYGQINGKVGINFIQPQTTIIINETLFNVNNSDYLDGYHASDFWKAYENQIGLTGNKSGDFYINTTKDITGKSITGFSGGKAVTLYSSVVPRVSFYGIESSTLLDPSAKIELSNGNFDLMSAGSVTKDYYLNLRSYTFASDNQGYIRVSPSHIYIGLDRLDEDSNLLDTNFINVSDNYTELHGKINISGNITALNYCNSTVCKDISNWGIQDYSNIAMLNNSNDFGLNNLTANDINLSRNISASSLTIGSINSYSNQINISGNIVLTAGNVTIFSNSVKALNISNGSSAGLIFDSKNNRLGIGKVPANTFYLLAPKTDSFPMNILNTAYSGTGSFTGITGSFSTDAGTLGIAGLAFIGNDIVLNPKKITNTIGDMSVEGTRTVLQNDGSIMVVSSARSPTMIGNDFTMYDFISDNATGKNTISDTGASFTIQASPKINKTGNNGDVFTITGFQALVLLDDNQGKIGNMSGTLIGADFSSTLTDVALKLNITNKTVYGGRFLASGGDPLNNWAIYNRGGDVHIANDNNRVYFGTANNFSIYFDGLNLRITNETTNTGIVYVDMNLSAENLIDRSPIWDKSKLGNALDWVKSSDVLSNQTKLAHSQLSPIEYATFSTIDYSRPVMENKTKVCYSYNITNKICQEEIPECYLIAPQFRCDISLTDDELTLKNGTKVLESYEETTYPYTATQEGRNIGGSVSKHEEAIYELNQKVLALEQENKRLKDCASSSKDFIEYQGCVLK